MHRADRAIASRRALLTAATLLLCVGTALSAGCPATPTVTLSTPTVSLTSTSGYEADHVATTAATVNVVGATVASLSVTCSAATALVIDRETTLGALCIDCTGFDLTVTVASATVNHARVAYDGQFSTCAQFTLRSATLVDAEMLVVRAACGERVVSALSARAGTLRSVLFAWDDTAAVASTRSPTFHVAELAQGSSNVSLRLRNVTSAGPDASTQRTSLSVTGLPTEAVHLELVDAALHGGVTVAHADFLGSVLSAEFRGTVFVDDATVVAAARIHVLTAAPAHVTLHLYVAAAAGAQRVSVDDAAHGALLNVSAVANGSTLSLGYVSASNALSLTGPLTARSVHAFVASGPAFSLTDATLAVFEATTARRGPTSMGPPHAAARPRVGLTKVAADSAHLDLDGGHTQCIVTTLVDCDVRAGSLTLSRQACDFTRVASQWLHLGNTVLRDATVTVNATRIVLGASGTAVTFNDVSFLNTPVRLVDVAIFAPEASQWHRALALQVVRGSAHGAGSTWSFDRVFTNATERGVELWNIVVVALDVVWVTDVVMGTNVTFAGAEDATLRLGRASTLLLTALGGAVRRLSVHIGASDAPHAAAVTAQRVDFLAQRGQLIVVGREREAGGRIRLESGRLEDFVLNDTELGTAAFDNVHVAGWCHTGRGLHLHITERSTLHSAQLVFDGEHAHCTSLLISRHSAVHDTTIVVRRARCAHYYGRDTKWYYVRDVSFSNTTIAAIDTVVELGGQGAAVDSFRAEYKNASTVLLRNVAFLSRDRKPGSDAVPILFAGTSAARATLGFANVTFDSAKQSSVSEVFLTEFDVTLRGAMLEVLQSTFALPSMTPRVMIERDVDSKPGGFKVATRDKAAIAGAAITVDGVAAFAAGPALLLPRGSVALVFIGSAARLTLSEWASATHATTDCGAIAHTVLYSVGSMGRVRVACNSSRTHAASLLVHDTIIASLEYSYDGGFIGCGKATFQAGAAVASGAVSLSRIACDFAGTQAGAVLIRDAAFANTSLTVADASFVAADGVAAVYGVNLRMANGTTVSIRNASVTWRDPPALSDGGGVYLFAASCDATSGVDITRSSFLTQNDAVTLGDVRVIGLDVACSGRTALADIRSGGRAVHIVAHQPVSHGVSVDILLGSPPLPALRIAAPTGPLLDATNIIAHGRTAQLSVKHGTASVLHATLDDLAVHHDASTARVQVDTVIANRTAIATSTTGPTPHDLHVLLNGRVVLSSLHVHHDGRHVACGSFVARRGAAVRNATVLFERLYCPRTSGRPTHMVAADSDSTELVDSTVWFRDAYWAAGDSAAAVFLQGVNMDRAMVFIDNVTVRAEEAGPLHDGPALYAINAVPRVLPAGIAVRGLVVRTTATRAFTAGPRVHFYELNVTLHAQDLRLQEMSQAGPWTLQGEGWAASVERSPNIACLALQHGAVRKSFTAADTVTATIGGDAAAFAASATAGTLTERATASCTTPARGYTEPVAAPMIAAPSTMAAGTAARVQAALAAVTTAAAAPSLARVEAARPTLPTAAPYHAIAAERIRTAADDELSWKRSSADGVVEWDNDRRSQTLDARAAPLNAASAARARSSIATAAVASSGPVAATAIAAAAGAVSPAAMTQGQRIAATARLAACDEDGPVEVDLSYLEYPLQFPLRIGAPAHDPDGFATLNGAAFASTLLVALSVGANEAAYVLYRCGASSDDNTAGPFAPRRKGLRHLLSVAAAVFTAFLAPSVVQAAVLTWAHGGVPAASALHAALAAVVLGCVGAIARRVCAMPPEMAHARSDGKPAQADYEASFGVVYGGTRAVADRLRRSYYFADVALVLVLAVLAGLRPQGAACTAVSAIAVLCCLAYVVYFIVLKPLASRVETGFMVALGAVQMLTAALAVAASTASEAATARAAAEAAVLAQVVLLALQCVVMGAMELARWCREQRQYQLPQQQQQCTDGAPTPPAMDVGETAAPLLQMPCTEDAPRASNPLAAA